MALTTSQAPAAGAPEQASDVALHAQATRRPLFHLALRAEGEDCLVVGGGPVGARKAASLLECGALVTVVAPRVCAALEALQAEAPDSSVLRIERRAYRAGEVGGYRLVITATGRPEIDRAVYLDCRRAGVLVNAADDPKSCSFLMPAVLSAGPVSVAVSTGGASPWLAGWVRRRVGTVVGPDVGLLTEIVGLARVKVRAAGHSSEGLDWGNLVDDLLWPLISAGQADQARSAADDWAASVISDGAGGERDGAGGERDGTGGARDGTGGERDGAGGERDVTAVGVPAPARPT